MLDLNNQLFDAIQARDTAKAKTLIDQGADLNAVDRDNETPLHVAARLGRTEIVHALIAANANVNARGHRDQNPLYSAAGYGHTETVQALIDAGADLNPDSEQGLLPTLHYSLIFNQPNMARALIAAGADVNAADPTSGHTLQQTAKRYGTTEVIEVIRDAHYRRERPKVLSPYALLMGLEKPEHAQTMHLPKQELSAEDNNLSELLGRFTTILPTELKSEVMSHLPGMTLERAMSYCRIFNEHHQQSVNEQATCTTTTSSSSNNRGQENGDGSPETKRRRVNGN